MFLLGCQPFFLTPCLGCSFLLQFFVGFFSHVSGKVGKEVIVENLGYAAEQERVHVAATEDVVDVGAVAVQFFGKPNHGSFLLPQFFLHKFSKMNHTLLFAERCLRSKLDLVRFAVRYSLVYRSRRTFFFKFCPSWGA